MELSSGCPLTHSGHVPSSFLCLPLLYGSIGNAGCGFTCERLAAGPGLNKSRNCLHDGDLFRRLVYCRTSKHMLSMHLCGRQHTMFSGTDNPKLAYRNICPGFVSRLPETSSSYEEGRELPAEEVDPFILSLTTTALATKLQDQVYDLEDAVADRRTERSLSGKASIKVVGVGGGGCNAVNEMVRSRLLNVEFWAINTDVQALGRSLAPHKLQIGRDTTVGRGAGGRSDVGEESATESLAELSMALDGADLVFVAAGMGGGTGSGAGPVVARLAKAMGALAIGIVTEPFGFEGPRRVREARKGVDAMRNAADTLVVVPNDRLLQTVAADTTILDAFHLADDVLRQGVQGISDIITVPGLVNVDFADVKAIMSNAGSAMLGIGVGFGKNRAEEVARSAIMSPLLRSVSRPMGIVYNVTGGKDLTLHEVNTAAEIVYSMADPNANVIFGAVIDESYEGMVRMTVIATGFRESGSGDHLAGGLVRTVEDDIFSWEQNPRRSKLHEVPEFLRRRDRRRTGSVK